MLKHSLYLFLLQTISEIKCTTTFNENTLLLLISNNRIYGNPFRAWSPKLCSQRSHGSHHGEFQCRQPVLLEVQIVAGEYVTGSGLSETKTVLPLDELLYDTAEERHGDLRLLILEKRIHKGC